MNIQSYEDVLAALRRLTADDNPESPKGRKRLRILTTAARLFERYGYRKASVSQLAREAGVAKGTVYLYFPSKAELLLGVMIRERLALYELMAPALEGDQDPRERLRAFLVQAVVHQDAMPISLRIKMGDPEYLAALEELDMAAFLPMARLFGAILGWLVREAAPVPLDPVVLHERVHVLIALLQGLPFVAHPRIRGPMALETFGDRLARMLVDGLIAPP